MSTTYAERVRSIAEEMAEKWNSENNKAWERLGIEPLADDRPIGHFLPLAEIALKHMGESFDKGFGVGCSATNILTEEEDILEYAYNRKHDLGLIKPE